MGTGGISVDPKERESLREAKPPRGTLLYPLELYTNTIDIPKIGQEQSRQHRTIHDLRLKRTSARIFSPVALQLIDFLVSSDEII